MILSRTASVIVRGVPGVVVGPGVAVAVDAIVVPGVVAVPDVAFVEGVDPDVAFVEGVDPDVAFVEGVDPDVAFVEGVDPDVAFVEGVDPDVAFVEGVDFTGVVEGVEELPAVVATVVVVVDVLNEFPSGSQRPAYIPFPFVLTQVDPLSFPLQFSSKLHPSTP